MHKTIIFLIIGIAEEPLRNKCGFALTMLHTAELGLDPFDSKVRPTPEETLLWAEQKLAAINSNENF